MAANLKVLEIDDNLENLEAVKAVLSRTLPGTAVYTAENGSKGLDLALEKDPDVILLDVVMPEMDGFEVCRRLKNDDRLKAIPVVFMAADQIDRDSRIKAIEVGGDGFLRKPFEVEELVSQVRTMAKIKADAGQEAERLRALNRELADFRLLPRLLPICVSCKKIRNAKGNWEEVEQYIKAYVNVDFTHGCCPDCAQKLYPEFINDNKGV